jgi:hypothetical protein
MFFGFPAQMFWPETISARLRFFVSPSSRLFINPLQADRAFTLDECYEKLTTGFGEFLFYLISSCFY